MLSRKQTLLSFMSTREREQERGRRRNGHLLNHCLVLLTAHQFSSEFTASLQPVLLWRRAEGQRREATDFRLHEKKQQ